MLTGLTTRTARDLPPDGPPRRRRTGVRPSPLRLVGLALAGLSTPWATGSAQDSDPFAIRSHDVRGRIVQVWPLAVAPCGDATSDLLVLSVEGGPPRQRRFATFMPCGSALSPSDPRIRTVELSSAAVAVDVAILPGRPEPQLVSMTRAGLSFERLTGLPERTTIEVAGGLPLPPRPWEIERLPIVGDWNADGRPVALVPTLGGGLLIDLETRAQRPVELPVYADYQSYMPDLPETAWKWLVQEVTWPALSRADDDADGRLDLFALSRWQIAVFRTGPAGLPSKPTRRLELVPFDEKTERRPRSSAHNYFARDLDGDGRAELVLNTIRGGLMDGRSTTRIHRGRPPGVSPTGRPDVLLEVRGGFAGVDFVDLEGDGMIEMLETHFEFGVLQLARLLTTRRAEIRVRVLALDPASETGVRELWQDDLSLALDFAESRFEGILPALGDWNGDGLLDLVVPRGSGSVSFRLGSRASGAPRFGPPTGAQPIALVAGTTRVADLDGDGLADLVAFSTSEPDPPLLVLQNLGRLPGSPSNLRSR